MQNEFFREERKGFAPPEKKSSGFWETIKFAIIALAIVVPVRAFVAQPFIVSGSSMVPTFQNSQYLIVDQISYRLNEPKRGDVIVFRYPNDTSKFYIKRIIGLPGEKVTIDGPKVTVETVEGEILELDEPYVRNEGRNNMQITTNENEYFVMGDNRASSSDSRYWGNLEKSYIVGKAFVRLLPVDSFGFKPGEFHNYNL
jgi:signal peptidase I